MFSWFVFIFAFLIFLLFVLSPMEVEESIDYLKRTITITPKVHLPIWKNVIHHTNTEKQYGQWRIMTGYEKNQDADYFWITVRVHYPKYHSYASSVKDCELRVYKDDILLDSGNKHRCRQTDYYADIDYSLSQEQYRKIASTQNLIFKLFKYDDTSTYAELNSDKISNYLKKFYSRVAGKKKRIEVVTKIK